MSHSSFSHGGFAASTRSGSMHSAFSRSSSARTRSSSARGHSSRMTRTSMRRSGHFGHHSATGSHRTRLANSTSPARFGNGRQNGGTPPGWSHGKKTGWGCTPGSSGCKPPGLAKKESGGMASAANTRPSTAARDRTLATTQPRSPAIARDRTLATTQPRTMAVARDRTLATTQPRTLAAAHDRTIATTQPRTIAAAPNRTGAGKQQASQIASSRPANNSQPVSRPSSPGPLQ
jgi:hypothetical protein